MVSVKTDSGYYTSEGHISSYSRNYATAHENPISTAFVLDPYA